MHGLSVDTEDWFHVANLESVIPRTSWDSRQFRLDQNLGRLLDLFDELDAKGTFFILGWVADRHPGLIRNIFQRGHEIACHGPDHRLVYELTQDDFRKGLQDEKKLLEDLTGRFVEGYRAPNFSITVKSWWSIDILAELGFFYDSSVFPYQRARYGVPEAPLGIFRHKLTGSGDLIELPLSVLELLGSKIPIAGGGYFRLLPGFIFRSMVQNLETSRRSLIFYIHPWEIDPDQPRPKGIPNRYRVMHYLNLSSTFDKLKLLLKQFHFVTLSEIAHANSFAPYWSPT